MRKTAGTTPQEPAVGAATIRFMQVHVLSVLYTADHGVGHDDLLILSNRGAGGLGHSGVLGRRRAGQGGGGHRHLLTNYLHSFIRLMIEEIEQENIFAAQYVLRQFDARPITQPPASSSPSPDR